MNSLFKKTTVGICTGVSAILLACAYVPNFQPTIYEKLRHTRMIYVLTAITALQVGSAIIWLYINSKGEK